MPPTISNHPSDIFELFACKNYNQNAAKRRKLVVNYRQ